jgi:hypothetical protein
MHHCLQSIDRLALKVGTVKFEKVEGEEEHSPRLMFASKPLEHSEPVLIAGDGLAIDQAGTAFSRFTASTMSG